MDLTYKPQNAEGGLPIADAAAKCKTATMEPKFDGWRFIVEVDEDGTIRILSRRGTDYTDQMPDRIMTELAKLPPGTIVDGEIADVVTHDCTAVTNVFGKSKAEPTPEEIDRLTYVVFDLLQIAGTDARANPLRERREALGAMLEKMDIDQDVMRLAPQGPATQETHDLIVTQGYEGVMIKDLDAPYASGKRGHGWFKIKSTFEIDGIIIDMLADGKGQHLGKVGRFVVGQYKNGELVERVKVNPYDDAMRDNMTASLEVPPGPNHPYIGKVVTIKHYGFLKDGLRHPVFLRWREDKPAEDCVWSTDPN